MTNSIISNQLPPPVLFALSASHTFRGCALPNNPASVEWSSPSRSTTLHWVERRIYGILATDQEAAKSRKSRRLGYGSVVQSVDLEAPYPTGVVLNKPKLPTKIQFDGESQLCLRSPAKTGPVSPIGKFTVTGAKMSGTIGGSSKGAIIHVKQQATGVVTHKITNYTIQVGDQ